jgi:hypothetical protein
VRIKLGNIYKALNHKDPYFTGIHIVKCSVTVFLYCYYDYNCCGYHGYGDDAQEGLRKGHTHGPRLPVACGQQPRTAPAKAGENSVHLFLHLASFD